MKHHILIFFVTSLALLYSCQRQGAHLPGVIFTAQQTSNDSSSLFRDRLDNWTPKIAQVIALEQMLPSFFDSSAEPNSKFIGNHLGNYKRQYLGFSQEGKHYIYVNAFCDDYVNQHPDWTNHYVFVMDGGSCYFRVIYDPQKKELFYFFTNNNS